MNMLNQHDGSTQNLYNNNVSMTQAQMEPS